MGATDHNVTARTGATYPIAALADNATMRYVAPIINGQRFAEEHPGAGTFNINTTAPGSFTVLKTL